MIELLLTIHISTGWLIERVILRRAESPIQSYLQLLEIMHKTPFRVTIANDINRAQDGIDLRKAFLRENRDVSYVWLCETECSMLEMFIALAERMDMMLEDDDTPYSLEWYFWEIVKNCGSTITPMRHCSIPAARRSRLYP